MAVAGEHANLRTWQIVQHEGFHQFVRSAIGEKLPIWLEEGIATYPADGSDYPRLPLLGLRAILKNRLKLTIDGKRKHVSLRSPLWRK